MLYDNHNRPKSVGLGERRSSQCSACWRQKDDLESLEVEAIAD